MNSHPENYTKTNWEDRMKKMFWRLALILMALLISTGTGFAGSSTLDEIMAAKPWWYPRMPIMRPRVS